MLIDFEEMITESLESEEARLGRPLKQLDKAGASNDLKFGAALFSRTTLGRSQIPAIRDLIGATRSTKWGGFLYKDRVSGPRQDEVPFTHPCLLDVRLFSVI